MIYALAGVNGKNEQAEREEEKHGESKRVAGRHNKL